MKRLLCASLFLGIGFINPVQPAPVITESKGDHQICGFGCSCTCLYLCGGFSDDYFLICYHACIGGCLLGGGV